jgi:hypothetical protein
MVRNLNSFSLLGEGEHPEIPKLVPLFNIAKESGISYHRLINAVFDGKLVPDADMNGRPLFRAERVGEIIRTLSAE